VDQVSWNDVMEYCKKADVRLPTEAEWEYAARAGSTTKYYWGKRMDGDYAWYGGNSGSKTHPGGQKKSNVFGLYDMSGNVWEWCSDWYDGKYYASSPSQNPKGASGGSYRVKRGGSWINNPAYLRSASRNYGNPDGRYRIIGFRVAFPAQ
jgi:formylglycine-generating enzyme required for sulfatase activity